MSKPKAVQVDLISLDSDIALEQQIHKLVHELIQHFHTHLVNARIAFAWNRGWSADADGILRLGEAKKASDLDKELHGYDFVILLNAIACNTFSESQLRALIDHELCHCEVAVGKDGEDKVDDKGRTVYRTRKHDVEEFSEVIERHGLYKENLKQFAKIALQKAKTPLLDEEDMEPEDAAA
jgi:predicted SprT family Zn-dependent metalloprotease